MNLLQDSSGDADKENRLVNMGQVGGESGMNGESSMESYTLPYVKQRASGNLLHNSGNSNWGSVTT